MSDLDTLIKRRGTVKSKLTIFSKFINNLLTNFPDKIVTYPEVFAELEQRLHRFQYILDDFEKIQERIDEIADNTDQQYLEREAFESSFFSNISKAKSFVFTKNQPQANDTPDTINAVGTQESVPPNDDANSTPITVISDSNQSIKLPIIQLPKFDGNYDTWLEFRDTFDSLIHRNSSISEIQKFHYLRASLSGSALQIIASLEFSSSSYIMAWELIQERYNNTRILTQNHVKALFQLEPITQESSHAMRKIVDNVTKHLRSLKSLKEPTDTWDTLIIYLITTKLDSVTSREWEQKKASFDTPSLDNLKNFLKDRADLLETLEQSKFNRGVFKSKTEQKTKSFLASKVGCSFCKKDHYIQNCTEFLNLSTNERIEQAKRAKLCINCLRVGHNIKQCRSSSCKHCQRRHHSLLHIKTTTAVPEQSQAPEQVTNTNSFASRSSANNTQVLLSTVLINVFDKNNKPFQARALLDAGSQSSFMTADLCDKLNINKSAIDIKVCGINETSSEIKYKSLINIKSCINNFRLQVNCLIVPRITNLLPSYKVELQNIPIPQNISLADPKFHIPATVDILLGADCFWQVISVGQVRLSKLGLILQKSRFGWIVSGPAPSNLLMSTYCNLSNNSEVDRQIARFWEIEEIITKKPLSSEEQDCETHFVQNTIRDEDGRFVVTIPLKESPSKLGDSYETAKKRFLSLERKFIKNPTFKLQYFDFIHQYINLGHMSRIDENNKTHISYYMPHHGVIKESSLTTRLRVVFDGSCPSSTGYSYNDLQMVGPTIQSDLLTILLRHRKHNYVIGADVEKMYRMCLVNSNQRALQRILWRDNSDAPIDHYELNTITYGTSSAAFLAIRCLYQLGMDCSVISERVSKVIREDFYVDDLLTGTSTVEEAKQIAGEVSNILLTAGFKLRKWISNDPAILNEIESCKKIDTLKLGANEHTKTLGLFWNGHSDSFLYQINDSSNKRVTKRSILSEISQIFDPLGLLSPCIILPKIILQEIWKENLSWDESVPVHLHTRWLQFLNELPCLNKLRIPRQVTCKDFINVEVHGFSDASTLAYGACVYIKSWNLSGNTLVRLICSKSKVAPLKVLTVPRLELMAALLLAKVIDKIKLALDMQISRITYWCDSTVVLGWLNTQPHLLQTFVANRVVNIKELSGANEWRHVPTLDNPADHISRGVKPSSLLNLDVYWRGPLWLEHDEAFWPILPSAETTLPELRKIITSHKLITEMPSIPVENYSNLTKLERTVAYCFRFRSNCLNHRENRIVGPLEIDEINRATFALVKISQAQTFMSEISIMKEKGNLGTKGKLVRLNPFLDKDGILRVGGRLSNSNFSYNKKHPILLSAKDKYTKLLFVREHIRLLHAGPSLLLATIREKYWPLQGRSLARKVVHQCIRCFRMKPKVVEPIMGNLPSSRLTPAPPFHTTAVDYAGPFFIKNKPGRGCLVTKCYVSVFVCFVTRAVHLELVSNLTSEAFLAAFRRFVARRGRPKQMYSDNGTNFIGANSELQELTKFIHEHTEDLTVSIRNEGVSWSFMPPHSPHFGGLHESAVRSMKHHLIRVSANAKLTFEQLYTLLVQIECILNSRPLSPMSNDPSDFSPLTPSHFLIGRPSTSLADPDVTEISENRLSCFQRIQQLQQHFWKRWSVEYVSELQVRNKWVTSRGQLLLNDLVIIKEDNQPPLKWCLGRIIKLHPGHDGISRVATVKTSTGVIKRSFTKLCPLPKQ